MLVALVTLEGSQALRSNVSSITFPKIATGQFVPDTSSGGFISTFSSWGPSNELDINPNIATPGGNIYSTFPLPLGAYAILSGTSMAAPYLTGVVAMWLSAKGAIDPLQLRDRLSITSSPLDFNNGTATLDGTLAPVIQQGAGFINASKLFDSTTILSPGFINLNVNPSLNGLTFQDTVNFDGTHVISVRNNGTETVSYSFSSMNALTVDGLNKTDSELFFTHDLFPTPLFPSPSHRIQSNWILANRLMLQRHLH
jgi:subtilisin family serine protease